MKQAVIDIGSNSMRLSVYETTETGTFTILFKDKIMAGLAGYVEEGALSPEGITRAILGLRSFRGTLRALNIPQVAVFATASLRNIRNTAQAVAEIQRGTGFAIEVLSGEEEARLGYAGAMEELALSEGLFVDIGGASTEVVRFAHGQLVSAVSCPVGSLKLYRDWVKKILPNQQAVESMKKAIRQATRGVVEGPVRQGLPLVAQLQGEEGRLRGQELQKQVVPRPERQLLHPVQVHPFQVSLVAPSYGAGEAVGGEEVHILGGPLVGDESHQSPEAPGGQRQACLLPHLPQEALLRALPLLALAANADPLVMIQVMLLFDPVEHQNLVSPGDVAQRRILHTTAPF